jgi:hypothetical protein
MAFLTATGTDFSRDDVDELVDARTEPECFWNKVSLSVLALDDEGGIYANIGNCEPGVSSR